MADLGVDFSKEMLETLQTDAEKGGFNYKEYIDESLRTIEEEVVKIIRYSGTSMISQYYALTTNPKQQFVKLTDSEKDIAFQIALIRYPEYSNSIDKLYLEVTGKKRKFEV